MLIILVYDSNAKITSGILNGNINQFGDFDMCLSAKSEEKIKGKYCLVSMQFETPNSAYLAALHQLAHSHFPFRSKLGDVSTKKKNFSFSNQFMFLARSSCPAIFKR